MKNKKLFLGVFAGLLLITGVLCHYRHKPKRGTPAFLCTIGAI
jgi:hypothetical protein